MSLVSNEPSLRVRPGCGVVAHSMIHPTAIVSPIAEIDATAEVGPHVVIEGAVRIGPRCRILPHAVLTGDLLLGADNTVGHGAVLGAEPQDLGFHSGVASGVRIGDGNTFREFVTIHRGADPDSFTQVGDGNFLMVGAHLGHNCHIGNRNVIANNCLLAGHVHMGDSSFIGGSSVFHQFLRIGDLVMIRGTGKYGQDIPSFTLGSGLNLVSGLNVVGLRRAGWSREERAEVDAAFRLFYRSGLNRSQALAEAAKQPWGPKAEQFWHFVKNPSKRGICAFGHGHREES